MPLMEIIKPTLVEAVKHSTSDEWNKLDSAIAQMSMYS
jgi:hypothetical protein